MKRTFIAFFLALVMSSTSASADGSSSVPSFIPRYVHMCQFGPRDGQCSHDNGGRWAFTGAQGLALMNDGSAAYLQVRSFTKDYVEVWRTDSASSSEPGVTEKYWGSYINDHIISGQVIVYVEGKQYLGYWIGDVRAGSTTDQEQKAEKVSQVFHQREKTVAENQRKAAAAVGGVLAVFGVIAANSMDVEAQRKAQIESGNWTCRDQYGLPIEGANIKYDPYGDIAGCGL